LSLTQAQVWLTFSYSLTPIWFQIAHRALLRACENYPDRANAVRVRAFVLLLRYSGLRIRDVVTLRRDRITKGGKLFLYTAKAGTAVRLPLPTVATKALGRIPLAGAEHCFWSGESKLKSAVGDW
jgi:integrase